MNNEDFVSYEIAQALKKAGFDLTCERFWYKEFADSKNMTLRQASADDFNNDDWDVPHCSAPSLWQAQKWLREAHSISVEPLCNMVCQWNVNVCDIDKFGEILWAKIGLDTYESALSAGIKAALKLIEIDKTKKS